MRRLSIAMVIAGHPCFFWWQRIYLSSFDYILNITAMGNFNRGGGSKFGGRDSGRSDDRGGFRGGYGGNRGGGRDRNEDREMFQATCTECGKSCEVPFRPSGGKPVLCRDCFRSARGDDRGGRDSGGRDFPPRSDRGGRDFSYRDSNERQSESGNVGGKSAEHFDQQFAQLNEKLDRILKRLTPSYVREQAPAEETTEELVELPTPKKVSKKKAAKN